MNCLFTFNMILELRFKFVSLDTFTVEANFQCIKEKKNKNKFYASLQAKSKRENLKSLRNKFIFYHTHRHTKTHS